MKHFYILTLFIIISLNSATAQLFKNYKLSGLEISVTANPNNTYINKRPSYDDFIKDLSSVKPFSLDTLYTYNSKNSYFSDIKFGLRFQNKRFSSNKNSLYTNIGISYYTFLHNSLLTTINPEFYNSSQDTFISKYYFSQEFHGANLYLENEYHIVLSRVLSLSIGLGT